MSTTELLFSTLNMLLPLSKNGPKHPPSCLRQKPLCVKPSLLGTSTSCQVWLQTRSGTCSRAVAGTPSCPEPPPLPGCEGAIRGRLLCVSARGRAGGCGWSEGRWWAAALGGGGGGWGGGGVGGCRRTRTHRGPQHLAITARDCTMSVRKYCTRHPFCFNCHPSSSFGQLWSGRRLLLPDITELLSFAAWHSLLVAVVESVHCGILCSQVISGQHGSRLSSAQTTGSGMWCVVNVPTLDFHNSYFWICCFHMLIYFMK